MAQPRDLYEFLVDAELEHYYSGLHDQLKVTSVAQLKYVEEEDLVDMGMTRPEMRRLKKYFKRECPQGMLGKVKKILKGDSLPVTPTSPGPPRSPLCQSKAPGRHIIPEESISLLKTLGTGEFGTVQQGVWNTDEGDRVQVAIKCLSKEKMQGGMSDFLKEATIMHSLDHDHIVRLYGVVLGSQALMLVTELAPLRSLLECLKEPSLRASLPPHQLCDFAQQIAGGMAFLEAKRFIHRDLAARNILVFAKNKVKVSDFGLSRALGVGNDYYQTNFNVNLKLPIAWCAPECINYLKFTSASDVWAFGVTMWEMFSYGFQPWAGFTGQQILDAIDQPNGQRLDRPDCCPGDYYDVMLMCWEHYPEKRVAFNELVNLLAQTKPDRVQAVQDCQEPQSKDFLVFHTGDIITVLDKKLESAPAPNLWRGALDSGRVGYFDNTIIAPYIDISKSPMEKKSKMSRKESARRSARSAKKFHAGMISGPKNDLRHTGHVGYDGAIFGDVAFIGNNYDKLPIKLTSPQLYLTDQTPGGSMSSLSKSTDTLDCDNFTLNSQSQASLFSAGMSESVVTGISTGSQEDTLTDVSSMMSEMDSVSKSRSHERALDRYEDIEDDFDNFRMPDFGLDLGTSLDLGPSLMDEVMRALSDPKPSTKPVTSLLDDKSPLLETDSPFARGKTSFDNVAMTTELDCPAGGATDTDGDSERGGAGVAGGGGGGGGGASLRGSTLTYSQETPDTRHGTRGESPGHEDEKRRRHKLKLSDNDDMFIPSREGARSKHDGMRPLSASDEKKIDEAIELANEFAQIRTADHMISSPRDGDGDAAGSGNESPRPRSMFSLRKRSPRQEKKSYTDEIASIASSDLSEDMTPEAQEVYNMLVVKGSTREKSGQPGTRERRSRRSGEHQDATSAAPSSGFDDASATGGASVAPAVGLRSSGRGRNINQNIREPQGIPGRAPAPAVVKDADAEESPEVDVNPLRRLRESQSIIPKPRLSSRSGGAPGGEVTNGWSGAGQRPNLNPNLSFFAKLKEQEQERERGATSPSRAGHHNGNGFPDDNGAAGNHDEDGGGSDSATPTATPTSTTATNGISKTRFAMKLGL